MQVKDSNHSRRRYGTHLSRSAAILPLIMLAAACGSSSKSSSTAVPSAPLPSPTSTASSSSSAAGPATAVTATETEFKIVLSMTEFHPGTYSFTAHDAGKVTHALEISGPGVANKTSSFLTAGQSAALTVTLQKGSYEIWCPVDGHKNLGMDTHITVT